MVNDYFIVSKRILPDYYEKVIEARELVRSGKAKDVSQAVKMVGISRSTYYKYKDDVFLPKEGDNGKKAVLSMILLHKPGILSLMLNIIAENGGNIITITQTPPISDRASVMVSLDISRMQCGINGLIDKLGAIPEIENVRLMDMA